MREQNIPALQALAQKVWHEHYATIISPGQIAYMLQWMYSTDALRRQLQAGHVFTLAYDGRNNLVGYASAECLGSEVWQLHKLYVDTSLHRAGVGTALLKQIEKANNLKRLQLGVNRQNFRAINFYFRNGFVITGCNDRPIGEGFVMTDFTMEKRYDN